MSRLPGHAKAKPIEIWCQDEARVGQKGSVTRLWAHQAHRSRYALRVGLSLRRRLSRSRRGRGHSHALRQCKAVSPGAHAVLVLDGAGWHRSQKLAPPENITLATLPPYSPELNPVENIWEYLRKNKLSNRLYQTYEDIVDACCEAWNSLMAMPERIASVASRDWAKVS